MTRIFSLLLMTSVSSADIDRYTERVREQLVYPRPLTLTIPNPVSTDTPDGAAMLRLMEILERDEICTLERSGSAVAIRPRADGEKYLVPVLNIANYKVSSWKLVLGTVDVSVRFVDEDEGSIVLRGKTVIDSTNEIYELIAEALSESSRESLAVQDLEWLLEPGSGLISERP